MSGVKRTALWMLLLYCAAIASAQPLRQPHSIAVAPDGKLFVATIDETTLKILSPSGQILAQTAPRGTGEQEVQFPQRVLLVGDEVWILDAPARRVQVYGARPPYRYLRTLPCLWRRRRKL